MASTICEPGWYVCAVTVTMPADFARELGAPECATYHANGMATRTFGDGLQTFLSEPTKDDEFASRHVRNLQSGLEAVPHSVDSYRITPVYVPPRKRTVA